MNFIRTSIILTLLFASTYVSAQADLSFRVMSITASPFEEENNSLELSSFGNSGTFAVEPGAILGAAIYTDERTSFQASLAAYNDKAGKPAGFASVHLKYKFAKKYKHSFTAGIGPSIFVRQSWNKLDGYIDNEVYTENGGSQYKMAWLSGELSYNYYFSKSSDLYISAIRTSPQAFGITAGVVFQLGGKKSRYGRSRGCDCPSYK